MRCSTLAGAVLALAAIAATGAAPASAACPDATLQPAAGNLPRVGDALVCAINLRRAAVNQPPLARNPKLDRSSEYHSIEMVRFHYFSHERQGRPSLLQRIQGFGYFVGARGGLYAENVGAGPGANGTASALVAAWMESDTHRANILHPTFRDVGVGIVLAGPDPAFYPDHPSTVYTTDFGHRYVRVTRRCRAAPRIGTRNPSSTPRRRYCRRRAR